MTSGALFFISFSDATYEARFKKWVFQGNDRSKKKMFGSMGLQARILKVRDLEYLFLWQHNGAFNMQLLLRLMFVFLARKMRRGFKLKRVKALDLADLILDRGFANGSA